MTILRSRWIIGALVLSAFLDLIYGAELYSEWAARSHYSGFWSEVRSLTEPSVVLLPYSLSLPAGYLIDNYYVCGLISIAVSPLFFFGLGKVMAKVAKGAANAGIVQLSLRTLGVLLAYVAVSIVVFFAIFETMVRIAMSR